MAKPLGCLCWKSGISILVILILATHSYSIADYAGSVGRQHSTSDKMAIGIFFQGFRLGIFSKMQSYKIKLYL